MVFLSVVPLAFMMGCMINNKKDYDLIGKKGIIEYPEMKAYVHYQTDTELEWLAVYDNGAKSTGKESLNYERFSDELHFLNWIEKDGMTVSQVINTKTGQVKTFLSYNDENSDRGGRSSVFMNGRFSFEK